MHIHFECDSALLRQGLARLFAEHDYTDSTPLGSDIRTLLQAPGKLLSPTPISARLPQGFWSLFPLALARYCQPSADTGLLVPIALSCELLLCALDYFDEIEDDDTSEERRSLGDGRLLNAAYTISILARRALSTLPLAYIARELRDQLLDIVDEELLIAVGGQHRDIVDEHRPLPEVTPEECLDIAVTKSGTLLRLVCRLATRAVDAPEEIVDLFAEVGVKVGTAFQIENDTHDLEGQLRSSASTEAGKKIGEAFQGLEQQISVPSPNWKSDLARAKKTLPIVLAAEQYATLQQSRPATDSREQEEREPSLLSRANEDAIMASLGCAHHLRKEANALVLQIEELQGYPLPQGMRILLGIETP